MNPKHLFTQKEPCKNCPFLKNSRIELTEGRLEGIIDSLHTDQVFTCHKSIDYGSDKQFNEDGTFNTLNHNKYCAGSMIYLEKEGRPGYHMRLGRALGVYDPSELKGHDQVIDPI
jgi:hypothetical protein